MKKKLLIIIPASLVLFLCLALKAEALSLPTVCISVSAKYRKNDSKVSEAAVSLRLTPKPSFIYYSQVDPLWKDYLYGGRDPMGKYGCGPTVLAMLVSNLAGKPVTPVEMADWAAEHGYWGPGGGSRHELIPEGAEAFGLKVESLSLRSPEALKMPLYYNKMIVLLMGPGHFTQRGHFIILTGVARDGTIMAADPFNSINNTKGWPAELLLDELSTNATAGGPIWVISAP